ncbi:hypothetical protein NA56DRAFT_751393 [Hyaloscypha hepaticicola]|uniref:Knr4/Smi1-like domain-containing protein n=1 Tax=Hyaloscypha hepaticicola TaxID=2082293 RepID=A0A2J6PWN5_9HELO|nr:hypothetical protein NA56DRAFT_751393 [Hyaloscypha hepaticicola]
MHPKFNPTQILRTIGEQELGYTLYDFAAEFAVLGYLEITRELVGLVNKYAPLYRETAQDLFKPLWLIWDMTGIWPGGEQAHVQRSANSRNEESNKGMREEISELAEQYETSSWENAGFKEKGEQVYDETRLRSCLRKLREFTEDENEWDYTNVDATTGYVAMSKSATLLKILENAAVLRKQGGSRAGEGLPEIDEIMGWVAKRLHANQMITYLTKSAKVWELLKDGALAKAIGVKEEKVQELGQKVIETFKRRYENGVQRSGMWGISVEEVVQIIEHNSINEAPKSFWNEMYGVEEEKEGSKDGDEGRPLTSILKDPLPRNDIAALEDRLNISLPNDYKDFLEATNGMGESWGGFIVEPPLFAASEISFNLLMDIYNDEQWPTVGTPLEIGSADINHVWLLPPPKVKEIVSMYLNQRGLSVKIKTLIENAVTSWAGSVREFENLEWCVMTWASGGAADMRAYPSFKAYLVYKAEASESEGIGIDNPERVCFSYSCR